jgi:hypothetical protein
MIDDGGNMAEKWWTFGKIPLCIPPCFYHIFDIGNVDYKVLRCGGSGGLLVKK